MRTNLRKGFVDLRGQDSPNEFSPAVEPFERWNLHRVAAPGTELIANGYKLSYLMERLGNPGDSDKLYWVQGMRRAAIAPIAYNGVTDLSQESVQATVFGVRRLGCPSGSPTLGDIQFPQAHPLFNALFTFNGASLANAHPLTRAANAGTTYYRAGDIAVNAALWPGALTVGAQPLGVGMAVFPTWGCELLWVMLHDATANLGSVDVPVSRFLGA